MSRSHVGLVLAFYFLAWSHPTAALNQTVTNADGSLVAVREIFTPWPVVVCQLVWSLATSLYSRWESIKKKNEPTVLSGVVWSICAVQAAGTVVVTIHSIVVGFEGKEGGTVELWGLPSDGVVIVAANLLAASQIFLMTESRVAHACGIGGVILEILVGLSYLCGFLALSNFQNVKTFPPPSVIVVVPDCYQGPSCITDAKLTNADILNFGQYLVGAIVLGGVLILVSILMLSRSRRNHREMGDDRIELLRTSAVAIAVIGGTLALATAILHSQSIVVDNVQCAGLSGFSCDNLGEFVMVGSPSGFLGLWASEKWSVIKSIFAW
jgi:hypothetical protein